MGHLPQVPPLSRANSVPVPYATQEEKGALGGSRSRGGVPWGSGRGRRVEGTQPKPRLTRPLRSVSRTSSELGPRSTSARSSPTSLVQAARRRVAASGTPSGTHSALSEPHSSSPPGG